MDSIPDFVFTQEFFWGVLVAGIAINFISEAIRRLFSNGFLLLNKKLRAKYERLQAQKTFELTYYSSSYEKLLSLKIDTLQTHISAIGMLSLAAFSYMSSFFVISSVRTLILFTSILGLVLGFSLFFRHIRQIDMCTVAERALKERDV